jgi:hypothetical protein
MDAIEAGYYFAGVLGISPRKWTLRQLWMMADGRVKASRRNNLELSSLVWGLSSIDWEDYLHYGQMTETGSGGPVQLKPELQEKIDAEVERIRRENPGLPTIRKAE